MKAFLKLYVLSTAGSLLGRAPVFAIPFVVLYSGIAGSAADQLLLFLNLCWFYPLVVSNVFLDIFVHGIKSRSILVESGVWVKISGFSSFLPTLIAFALSERSDPLFFAASVFFVWCSSLFGLLATRELALRIAQDLVFISGVSNIARVIIFIPILIQAEHVHVWVLGCAALAELSRFIVLRISNSSFYVEGEKTMPPQWTRLVGGALLVALSVFFQRWLLSLSEEGFLLIYEVAEKIYSLVALGLTLGLSGVLQGYISKIYSEYSKEKRRMVFVLGALLGIIGAILCLFVLLVFNATNEFVNKVSAFELGQVSNLVYVFSLGFVPAAITMVYSRLFIAAEKGNDIFSLSIFSCLASVFMTTVGYFWWGVMGVALATVAVNFFVAFFYFHLSKGL